MWSSSFASGNIKLWQYKPDEHARPEKKNLGGVLTMNENLMNAFLTFAMKIQSQRHLSAIKNGFTTLLPIIIVGSFCTLFSNIVCNTNPGYLSVANIPGLSFLGNLKPMFDAANYGTMNMMAIGACILISMELANTLLGESDWSVPVTAIACYISLVSTSIGWTAKDASGAEIAKGTVTGIANTVTNAQGLFVAMLVALVATELYCALVKSGKLDIKMPDSVPSNVAKSFSVLFPCCLTIFIVSGVGLAFKLATGMTLPEAIIKFIQTPLAGVITHPAGYMLLVFMSNILWLFGIHGTNTLKGIYEPFMLAAFAENEAAYAAGTAIPNIINTPFMSCFGTITGAGVTGGLLIAIMLFSKREDWRAIAKLAIPCGIFNINEPLTFGLPIVLNPLLAVPFCLSPFASNMIGYWATKIGFCGRMVVNAPWTTPPGIMAFLASGGNIGAAITQIVAILVAAVIYTPFVIAANNQKPAED
jgi:PTS system cellobiose-specific IIC component